MAPLSKRRRLTPTSSATGATATVILDPFLKSALVMEDPSISIGLSLERILDSSPVQSDKERLIDGATRVAYSLMDAAMRSARKLATTHNSSVWPLPAHLTTKVFSMLDTESVCCASAACSLFRQSASDPLCYANIDLTRSVARVSNPIVSTMIQRAGKNLRSIKLGKLPQDKRTSNKSPLTGSCLSALVLDGGAAGLLLRQLHLYNLQMKGYDFFSALSACQSLVELEIVGGNIRLVNTLRAVCEHCHSIQSMCLDIRATRFYDALKLEAHELENLIKKCPLLSSVALRGYEIKDKQLSVLIKGSCFIKSLDISGCYGFLGIFLRDLGNGDGMGSLKTLILRDCENLRAEEVSVFLSALRCGDWKALRYVDISNRWGFPEFSRHNKLCAIDVSQILRERPDIHLIADFPPELCFYGGDASSSTYSSDATSSSDFSLSSSSSSSSSSSTSTSSSSDRED